MKICAAMARGTVLEQVIRDIREVGVEVRVVCRDTHPVGADEPGRRLNLRFAPFHRCPAVAPKVLLWGQGQVGCMRVTVLGVVPLNARQQTQHPRVLGFQKANPKLGMELE